MIAQNTIKFQNYIHLFSSRDMVPLECPQCHLFFLKVKHDIQSKFGLSNNRNIICCSRTCLYKFLSKKETVQCLQCNKFFIKKLNQIKKSPNHFCSTNCAGKYNNAHKTTGTRRSKLEKWIEEQVTILFPNLLILYNDVKSIKSELDIYIPSLQLAFEINGIFHYEPIYGEDKLKNIKLNDSIRAQKCHNLNIKLININISAMKKFSPKNSETYLQTIKENIICGIEELNSNNVNILI